MSQENVEAAVQRAVEAWNADDLDALAELDADVERQPAIESGLAEGNDLPRS